MKTKKEFEFSNGDEVTEKVTGFTGIITGTCFYITGCDQFLVVAKSKDKFTEAKSQWYDAGRLTLVKEQVVTVGEVKDKDPGCDMPAPNRG